MKNFRQFVESRHTRNDNHLPPANTETYDLYNLIVGVLNECSKNEIIKEFKSVFEANQSEHPMDFIHKCLFSPLITLSPKINDFIKTSTQDKMMAQITAGRIWVAVLKKIEGDESKKLLETMTTLLSLHVRQEWESPLMSLRNF